MEKRNFDDIIDEAKADPERAKRIKAEQIKVILEQQLEEDAEIHRLLAET